MEKSAKKYYTPQEYLAMEAVAETKSEYLRGEIFAFAGASINHDRIAGNLYIHLNTALKDKGCEAFSSDLRVWIESRQLFTYPDVSVVCGQAEFYENRDDTITNPILIVEVLSESTRDYDRGQKFVLYRAIPALREHVLVEQYACHVEHFSKNSAKKWVLSEYHRPDHVLTIPALDFSITLKDIYDKVKFPAKQP